MKKKFVVIKGAKVYHRALSPIWTSCGRSLKTKKKRFYDEPPRGFDPCKTC
jgi:hypothetical protein